MWLSCAVLVSLILGARGIVVLDSNVVTAYPEPGFSSIRIYTLSLDEIPLNLPYSGYMSTPFVEYPNVAIEAVDFYIGGTPVVCVPTSYADVTWSSKLLQVALLPPPPPPSRELFVRISTQTAALDYQKYRCYVGNQRIVQIKSTRLGNRVPNSVMNFMTPGGDTAATIANPPTPYVDNEVVVNTANIQYVQMYTTTKRGGLRTTTYKYEPVTSLKVVAFEQLDFYVVEGRLEVLGTNSLQCNDIYMLRVDPNRRKRTLYDSCNVVADGHKVFSYNVTTEDECLLKATELRTYQGILRPTANLLVGDVVVKTIRFFR